MEKQLENEKWTIVTECPTGSSYAMEITDAMLHSAEDNMHSSGLCMDKDHIGNPTDL
jgi:hypothetical protein